MPNVFISYVRENAALVDRLAGELRAHDVTVWLDRDKIMPGQRWQDAIRQAIREGDYFIACFSAEYVARRRSYMNTEIGLAIEILQEMSADRIWFIPVLLSECEIPDRSIGGGQTLRDLHWEPLHKDWTRSVRRVLQAMGIERLQVVVPEQPVEATPLEVLTITDPIWLELVRVPAGEFLMGSDPGKDKGAYDNETPQHRLSLPEFYIGKYPLMNEQYAVFVEQTKGTAPEHWQGGKIPLGKEKHPVVNISWQDVRMFCEWVSQATGGELRLASEAEWEKGARGVDGRLYPWGNQAPGGDMCNFDGKIGDTTPVDRYSRGASSYGALDMAGNVWEWTSSLFKPYPYDPADGREDQSGTVGRVVRGGSLRLGARYVRCAYRSSYSIFNRSHFFGFRVVLVSSIIMPPSSEHSGSPGP